MIRSNTVIYIRWKLTNRVDVFTNLGKMYSKYDDSNLGVSRSTLNKKDLFKGWENDTVEIKKINI